MACPSPVLSITGIPFDWMANFCRCRSVGFWSRRRRSGADWLRLARMLFAESPRHRLPKDGYRSADSRMHVERPKGSEVHSVREAVDLAHGKHHAIAQSLGETMKCESFQGEL